jgi:hypothetical protein
MLGEEKAYLWRTWLYLAASASAEFFADIALSPMEAVKVCLLSDLFKLKSLMEYDTDCMPKYYSADTYFAGKFFSLTRREYRVENSGWMCLHCVIHCLHTTVLCCVCIRAHFCCISVQFL